jgi:hypothetical protein
MPIRGASRVQTSIEQNGFSFIQTANGGERSPLRCSPGRQSSNTIEWARVICVVSERVEWCDTSKQQDERKLVFFPTADHNLIRLRTAARPRHMTACNEIQCQSGCPWPELQTNREATPRRSGSNVTCTSACCTGMPPTAAKLSFLGASCDRPRMPHS